MVIKYEAQTHELTEDEKSILDLMINCFMRHNSVDPIKADVIIAKTNIHLKNQGIKYRLTAPRLRKIVNYIRVNELLPLIAGPNGYYVCYDKDVVMDEVKSLLQRAGSIQRAAQGLMSYAL